MLSSLLMTFGVLGIAFGLFGIMLARSVFIGDCEHERRETNHNAGLLLVTGATLLVVSMAWVG